MFYIAKHRTQQIWCKTMLPFLSSRRVKDSQEMNSLKAIALPRHLCLHVKVNFAVFSCYFLLSKRWTLRRLKPCFSQSPVRCMRDVFRGLFICDLCLEVCFLYFNLLFSYYEPLLFYLSPPVVINWKTCLLVTFISIRICPTPIIWSYLFVYLLQCSFLANSTKLTRFLKPFTQWRSQSQNYKKKTKFYFAKC